jgi:hypothetical protein
VLKDYPALGLARYWSVVLAYDFASAPYRVAFHGQTAALRGRLAALAGLQATLRRRQLVQRRRRATWSEIRAAMSALEPPWAVPRRYRHLEGRGGT